MTTAALGIKCPLCDAEPGEKCYDPNGDLPFKDTHLDRQEAAQAAVAERKTVEQQIEAHTAELNKIERDMGALAHRRKVVRELLAAAEAKLD